MDAEVFVEAIREHVRDAAVDGSYSSMESPPGRRPREELRERSEWFNRLPTADREFVRRAMADAAHAAVFGFFAVLDGARVIADGHFELTHVGERRVLLNDPQKIDLHDLLRAGP